MIFRHFIILLTFGLTDLAAAAEIGRVAIPEKKVTVVLKTTDDNLAAIPLNKMVSLTAEVLGAPDPGVPSGVVIMAFDAVMPEHNHGMIVTPKVTSIGQDKWRVDGVKLHMMGNWELSLFIEHDGKDHRYTMKLKI